MKSKNYFHSFPFASIRINKEINFSPIHFNKTICDCRVPCDTAIYSSYIMNRSPFRDQPVPSAQIWIYFTSKLVGIIEERFNYDGTQFLADIGGSLGFLLGLSVLGFIGILGKVVVKPYFVRSVIDCILF